MASAKFGQSLKSLRQEKGFTQENLAAILGSSSRYISFVETERSHPSRVYLINMAEALELPNVFRDHILINAGHAPVSTISKYDETDKQKLIEKLTWQADNFDPYPATVVDQYWDVQYANQSTLNFLKKLNPSTLLFKKKPLNHIDLMLSPEGCRPYIYNLFDTEVFFLGMIKSFCLRYPEEEKYKELLERLIAYSDIWSKQNINLLQCDQDLFTTFHFKTPKADFEVQSLHTSMRGKLNSSIEEYWISAACPASAEEDKHYQTFMAD